MGLLENRVALVMGGASGLGEAISHRFAAEGAAVVVADVDGNGAERVAREIQATGASAVGAPCDVTNRADVETTIEVARAMGPLRVRVLDVNLKGPFLCMRAAIPAMVANGGGSVIALGSTLGLIVAPGHPAYCAS